MKKKYLFLGLFFFFAFCRTTQKEVSAVCIAETSFPNFFKAEPNNEDILTDTLLLFNYKGLDFVCKSGTPIDNIIGKEDANGALNLTSVDGKRRIMYYVFEPNNNIGLNFSFVKNIRRQNKDSLDLFDFENQINAILIKNQLIKNKYVNQNGFDSTIVYSAKEHLGLMKLNYSMKKSIKEFNWFNKFDNKVGKNLISIETTTGDSSKNDLGLNVLDFHNIEVKSYRMVNLAYCDSLIELFNKNRHLLK